MGYSSIDQSEVQHATEVLSQVSLDQNGDQAEVLQTSIKVGTVAQVVVATIAGIGLIYLLKLVLVTTLSSMLLAYVLEPLVGWLTLVGFLDRSERSSLFC